MTAIDFSAFVSELATVSGETILPFFRTALGGEFVDYYTFIKNAEIERFQAEVTEWEQREYFEMF